MMKLDPTTLGDSPAAMYLVDLLNKRDDRTLARKIGKILSANRETLNDLAKSNLHGKMSLRTFNRMLGLISEYNKNTATATIKKQDPFIAHLVVNVLEGDVKSWKRRSFGAVVAQRNAIRKIDDSFCETEVRETPFSPVEFVDPKTPDVLKARSKIYLSRKNKPDTLY